jgi:hypothetical protein
MAALRGPSLVAIAALPAARGALDERRLVGTATSDLNTLAGVRGARSASPCECEDRKIKLLPFEDMASGGAVAYLTVEKPRFLFLEGSTGVVSAADVATAALPDTSAARTASLMDCLATGTPAPAPGAGSSAASAALGEGGAGSHLSGRSRPPSLSSSSSSSDDEYS